MENAAKNKRRAILEAAAELFGRNGFHETRMEEIAARAGVAKGTVYEYFPSKEDLFRGIIGLSFARYLATAKAAADPHARPADQLAALLRSALDFALQNRDLARVIMEHPPRCHAGLQDEIRATRAQVRLIYEEVIANGIACGEFRPLDPGLTATALMGVAEALLHEWLFAAAAPDPAQAAARCADLLLRGLSPRPATPRG